MKFRLSLISFAFLLLTAFLFPTPTFAVEGTFTASDYSFDSSTNILRFTADNFNPPRTESTDAINDIDISLFNGVGQLVLDYFSYHTGDCFEGDLPNLTTIFEKRVCYNNFWHADLPNDNSLVYLRIAQSSSGEYRSQPIPANQLRAPITGTPMPTPPNPYPADGTFTASNVNFDPITHALHFDANNFNPPRTAGTGSVNDFSIALYNAGGVFVLDYYNYHIDGCYEGDLPNLTSTFDHITCYNTFWHADLPNDNSLVNLRVSQGASGSYRSQPIPASQLTPPTIATFSASADTYIKSGSDNRNTGAGTFMRLQSSGENRSLVRFNQSALQSAIGSKQVRSAKLRLTITDNGNNWGTTGRTIDVHRLIANWDEGNGTENDRGTGNGATWNCAIDTLIENQTKNCSGVTEWQMGQPNNPSVHPWIQTPSATQTITNNQSGVVEFDVTNDVASFLSGTNPNYGWIIKKTNEGQNGQVSFGTKESSSVPQLEVTY